MQNIDHSIDARGLSCPLPILRIRKAIKEMETGQVLQMTATDPGSRDDVQTFCEQTGHELLSSETQGKEFIFVVRKN